MLKIVNETCHQINQADCPDTSTNEEENDETKPSTFDSSQFAATSKNVWCISYNLYEDDDTASSSIYDDINNGELFDWNKEVENFISLLKLLSSYQPKNKHERSTPKADLR
jgi:hypothetical protein